MKKMLAQKIIRILMHWFRSRFARRAAKGKPKFGGLKRHKKLSSRHIHLLRVARLLKNNFRQAAWTKQ